MELYNYLIIPHSLSILAYLWLFKTLVQISNVNLSLKMILILGSSDCIFHATGLMIIFTKDYEDFMVAILDFSTSTCLYFSLIWSSCMAYVIYNSLLSETESRWLIYTKKSLWFLVSPTLVLSMM